MAFDIRMPQDRLLALLRAAGRAVSGRAAQPVLSGLLLTADAVTGKLTACGYDLALGIRAEGACVVAEGGSAVVPYRMGSALVAALPEGSLVRLVDEGAGSLTIEAGEGRYAVALSHEPDDFPALPTVADVEPLALPFGAVKRALNAVAYAAATEEGKQILCGVEFALKDGGLRLSGVDGNRGSIYTLPEIIGTGEVSSFVVPLAAAKEAVKLGLADDDLLLVSHTQAFAMFDAGDAAIITNLIAGTFPEFTDLLPKACSTVVILDLQGLIHAVERAAIVAAVGTGAVSFSVNFGTGDVSISAANDAGSAADLIAVEKGSKGKDFELILSSRYCLDALRHVETDMVSLGFRDPRMVEVSPVGSSLHRQMIAAIQHPTA